MRNKNRRGKRCGREAECGEKFRAGRSVRAIGLCAVLLTALFLPLTGCGSQAEDGDTAEEGPVEISIILTINSNSGVKTDEDVVNAFNEEYEGVYHVNAEWIMETEEEERTNMKQLNVTDELPTVLENLRAIPSFYRRMVEDDRLVDLSSYILEDEEWMEMIEPAALECVTEEDGSIYLGPVSSAAFTCAGIFWNEELFAEAGIESFPETWDEFWDCCDSLQAAGITPLALHTEGTAWAPMLLATAEVGSTDEGLAFLKELFPDTYDNDSGRELIATLEKLFTYTTEDALYEDFDVAYDNFFTGKCAMIPNGYWMIEQIPENMLDVVRFASYPEHTMVTTTETYCWAVISSYSEEEIEAAIAFLKFRTRCNQAEKKALFADGGRNEALVVQDYIAAFDSTERFVPNYQTRWSSTLQEETFGEYLPLLVTGEITAEEFLAAEEESIVRFNAEQ